MEMYSPFWFSASFPLSLSKLRGALEVLLSPLVCFGWALEIRKGVISVPLRFLTEV